MNKKAIGLLGEQTACEYLERKGYKILERNIVICGVEVDIIAQITNKVGLFKGEKFYVFCEVKTRNRKDYGYASEMVSPYQQGRYIKACKAYMIKKHLLNENFRFDVIAVDGDEIEHIESAFDSSSAKFYKKY